MRRFFAVTVVAGLTVCALAIEHPSSAGFYDADVLWLSNNVHVCFEHSFATENQWVKEDVEAAWATNTALHFIWDMSPTCAAQQGVTNIHVNVSDTTGNGCSPTYCGTAYTNGLGRAISGMPNAVNICYCESVDPAVRRNYFHTAATHEFGHALALQHEQERLDMPAGSCYNDDRTGSQSYYYTIGPFDANSLMYYCSSNDQGVSFGLTSPEDSYSIGYLYGANQPYSVTSQQSGDIDVIARRTIGAPPAVRTFTGGAWGAWIDLGFIGQPASAPASVAWDSTRLDVFVASTTGSIMTAHRTGTSGGTWSAWAELTGATVYGGEVVAASRAPNRLTVFAWGQDNRLLVREWDGTQWQPWIVLAQNGNGKIEGKPSVVVAQDGSLLVFVHWAGIVGDTGQFDGTQHGVRYMRSTAVGSWPSFWTDLGGETLGSPGAVAKKNSANAFDVFVFARGANDNAIWYREIDSSLTPGPWTSLGSPSANLAGSPSAVSRDLEKIDVFLDDTAGQIWETWRTSSGWGGWGQTPAGDGSFDGSPVAVATSANEMYVFTRYIPSYGTSYEHYSCSRFFGCSWSLIGMPFSNHVENKVF